MSALSKNQIKVAANKSVKMNLDCQHITTTDFMLLQPVYYRHMIPGENLSVNAQCISRLAPLALPTYGRANLNLRAFFVPYRTINPTWDEFIADTVFSNPNGSAIPVGVPEVSNAALLALFTTASYGNAVDMGTSAIDPYDLFTNGHYYVFTPKGRILIKQLNSLGYKVVPGTKKDFKYNALAILAFAKVYVDWYSLAQYQHSSAYLTVKQLLAYNNPSSSMSLNANDIDAIFTLLPYVSYDQDYFTSQWDNPVAPSSGNFSTFTQYDFTTDATSRSGVDSSFDNYGTPLLRGYDSSSKTWSSSPSNISEYSLHLLHAVNDYVKRHQMSGARTIDRLLSQFGIQLKSEKLNRSVYLGNDVIPMSVGDVTSTSATSSAGLGDYAGQAFLRGQGKFEYECEEFGMFIICASVMPAVDYPQGFDRHNLSLDKTDFFNPEFDNLGVQAVSKGELYISKNDSFNSSNMDAYHNSMGFLPRYAHYKTPRSFVTGDLSLDTMNLGKDGWHLMRLFDDSSFNNSVANISHSIGLCDGSDHNQYDRIFQQIFTVSPSDPDEKEYFDHFYMFYNFQVTSFVPALPLYDTYTFEDADGHPSVTIEPNGSKLN